MLSFEQAGSVLDDAVEALPQEIFADLNGGVNLIPGEKRDEDGDYIMGLYHHDTMGRYIEIFYGSFAALYPDATEDEFARELKNTLHHELTHHIENKAGDRTLERWDEEQKALMDMGAPLETDSVLFLCGDGVLAMSADAMFIAASQAIGGNVKSACAALDAPAVPSPEAVKAALSLGADISGSPAQQVTAQLLEGFGAVLCMTMEQADTLAERFPAQESKIMCLGPKDIRPPRTKGGWGKTMRAIKSEIDILMDELYAQGE
jgi:protein-tyrosine-phosphatase